MRVVLSERTSRRAAAQEATSTFVFPFSIFSFIPSPTQAHTHLLIDQAINRYLHTDLTCKPPVYPRSDV